MCIFTDQMTAVRAEIKERRLRQLNEDLDGRLLYQAKIVDYVNAFRALEYGAEGEMVYNPTASAVSFRRGFNNIYTVRPGETLVLS